MAAGVGSEELDHSEALAVGAEAEPRLSPFASQPPTPGVGAVRRYSAPCSGPRPLRDLPSTRLLADERLVDAPHELAVDVARSALSVRARIRAGREPEPLVDFVLEELARAATAFAAASAERHRRPRAQPRARRSPKLLSSVSRKWGPDTRTSSTTSSRASVVGARPSRIAARAPHGRGRPRSWSTTTRPGWCRSRSPPSRKAAEVVVRAGAHRDRRRAPYPGRARAFGSAARRGRNDEPDSRRRLRAGNRTGDAALLLRVHQSNFRVVIPPSARGPRGAGPGREASWPPSRRRPGQARSPRLATSRCARASAGRCRSLLGRQAPRRTAGGDRRRASGAVERLRRHSPSARCAPTSSLSLRSRERSPSHSIRRPEIGLVLRMLHEPVEKVRARAERLMSLVGGDIEESVAERAAGRCSPSCRAPVQSKRASPSRSVWASCR